MPTLTWIQGQATGTVTFDDMKSAKLGLSSCGAKFWDHMDIKIKINGAGLVLELQQALGMIPGYSSHTPAMKFAIKSDDIRHNSALIYR